MLACTSKRDNWITFNDPFDIGSISLPAQPIEVRDTTLTATFKLVSSINTASLSGNKSSPSDFSYDLYFPTNINEFDLYTMKKDSAILSQLFSNMINGAAKRANSIVTEKNFFSYPEPAVKVRLLNSETGYVGVCRIIIFDNYVVCTSAVGIERKFSNEVEEKFFESLKINPKKRNRN